MAQLHSNKVVPPFAEVDVWKNADGTLRVKATLMMRPTVENAQTGLAIDGSNSMADMFGHSDLVPGDFFGSSKPNHVQPVSRKIAEYLANFDSDGETTVIYFACGKFGKKLQVIGELNAERAMEQEFSWPEDPGTGTCLVPAINYFLDHFKNAPWLICLFITDGIIDDLEETKALSKQICEDMASGKRGFTKFVIIGLGKSFSSPETRASKTLEELDDLDDDPVYGVEGQDLWDHKLAPEIKTLDVIFAEVVSEQAIVCPSAEILDDKGNSVRPEGGGSYSDGLPSLLRFTMDGSSKSFTLRLPNGKTVTQDISSVL